MAARREEIIQTARQIIMEKGLAGLSTTELCRAAGISMGALYTHFASKEDVILGIAEWTTDHWAQLYDFQDAKEMRERLLKSAAASCDPALIRKFRADIELLSASHLDPRLGGLWQSFRESRHLIDAIRRLVRVGELRADLDAEAAATAIVSLLIGLHFISLVGDKSGAEPVRAMALLLDDMMPGTKGS